jgi:hypothetical protein
MPDVYSHLGHPFPLVAEIHSFLAADVAAAVVTTEAAVIETEVQRKHVVALDGEVEESALVVGSRSLDAAL